jgi:hypothetical protein
MTLSTGALNPLVFGVGVVFIFSSIIVLLFNQRQRAVVLDRLHFRSRRSSGANTPPRSLSPDKKMYVSPSTGPDYSGALPPSLRSTLPELAQNYTGDEKKILAAADPSINIINDLLPIDQSYLVETKTPKYTPMGFSTEELKALGDFPAYDVLTGVPLPQEYKSFDPKTALPRPYRPLRWAYHQTMCKSSCPRYK